MKMHNCQMGISTSKGQFSKMTVCAVDTAPNPKLLLAFQVKGEHDHA